MVTAVCAGAGLRQKVCGPNHLGGVFDNHELMFSSQGEQWCHIGALATEVYGDDGLRACGDAGYHLCNRQVEGRGLDIHEDRHATQSDDRGSGFEEGIGGGDHLVASGEADCHQREQQRIASGSDADGVRGAAITGHFRFKRVDVGA